MACGEPVPEREALNAEIERAMRGIAGLERQSALLQHALEHEEDRNDAVPLPEPVPLAPLAAISAPEPPRILRVPRDAWADPKWDKARRELVDPVPVVRAYLERTCRPPRRAPRPFWPPANSPEVADPRGNFWEGTLESLDVDPVEQHVRDLCIPY